LEFALRCTEGEGSVMETLHDGEIYFEAAAGTMKPHVGMRKPRAGSMSTLCVERGEALCCNDTSTNSPSVRARSELLNIGSMIAVPIKISADVTVVLKVTAERRFAFSASDLTTLQLIATNLLSGLRAAEEFTVLEAAELEQRLYARQLQALHAIATTASGQGDDQIDEALRLGLEQLDLDWAFLGVIDEAAAELVVERSFARNGERVLDVAGRVPLSAAGLAAVTRSDGVFIVPDAGALENCERYRGWSSYISVPLHVGGKRYGAVGFTSRDVRLAAFSETDAKFLAVAAELIAAAIESRIKSEQLALSETRYRALTDAMPQLVWVIDEASNIHYVNARWSAYTGLDLERSVTMASEVIVGSEYPIVAPRRGTAPPKEFECEVRLRNHAGFYRWHLVRGVSLRDTRGRDARWIVTGTDIEERKSAEAAYATLHDAALAATEAKSRFLATMSHELRTPMNGVIGMTELLLSTPLSVEQNEYTQIVHDSGLSLLRLLNDILDYSKIEAGKLEIEAIDFELQKQIDSVVHLMRSQFEAKGVALASFIDPAIPADVVGDPGRLRQILINLVGNALKFTDRGGYVHVIVTSKGTGGDRVPVEILVEDTGIGIPPDVVERLFQPFAQGDESTTRKYGGTGLGLSICAQLVALMHGRITVESTVGKGSSFRFGVEFTLAHGRQHLPHAGSREPAAVERMTGRAGKILLVEDNDINTRLAVAQFKKIGFDVGVVVNGRLAVEAVQRERYDLVFMDCHMPEMDGFAATSEIRQLERGTVRRLPIVALTADARHEDQERCLTAGMDDYLSKPTTLGKLRAAVDRWLPPANAASA
jgi:PAS domain S-box-containing protein